jgi:hypothetical protein
MFENRVLRRIFGPQTEEVAGGWRRLHNEELHNLYALPNIIILRWLYSPMRTFASLMDLSQSSQSI